MEEEERELDSKEQILVQKGQTNDGGGDGLWCLGDTKLLDYSDFFVAADNSSFFQDFNRQLANEGENISLDVAVEYAQTLWKNNFETSLESLSPEVQVHYSNLIQRLKDFTTNSELKVLDRSLSDAGFMGSYSSFDSPNRNQCALVQLAITCNPDNLSEFCREAGLTKHYTISETHWPELDNMSRVGLVLHEALYRYYLDLQQARKREQKTSSCQKSDSLSRDPRLTSSNVRLINYLLSQGRLLEFPELLESGDSGDGQGFLNSQQWVSVLNKLALDDQAKITGLRLDGGSMGSLNKLDPKITDNLLYLYGNRGSLSDLDCLPESMQSLVELGLSHNKLSSLVGMPQSLPQLKYLFLNNNSLKTLEGMLPSLPSLKFLMLRQNQLEALTGMSQDMPKLELLDLAENRLKSFEGMSDSLESLVDLNANENRLANLQGMSSHLPSLKYLSFSDNSLESLEGMTKELDSLKILGLNENKLTSLRHLPQSLENLEVLNLQGNSLTNLEFLPQDIGRLLTLSLDNNNLESFEYLPQKLDRLMALHAPGNNISSLKYLPLELPDLYTLELSGNKLTNLDGIPKLPFVLELNLSGNDLTDVSDFQLGETMFLEDVNLNDNDIKDVSSLISQQYNFSLEGNPIETSADACPIEGMNQSIVEFCRNYLAD